MRLPHLDDPSRYAGLYVFDFGEWCAVGYTADEIATLLESDQYADGKIYKIQRVSPDGQTELRGVSRNRFQLESGMFFQRGDLDSATSDFEQLKLAAEGAPPPCRARVHLTALHGEPSAFLTAVLFPAEYEDEIGNWLNKIGFAAGDVVEGGMSHAGDYESRGKTIFERHQLFTTAQKAPRQRDELLACVHEAVQR